LKFQGERVTIGARVQGHDELGVALSGAEEER
jgi:hypothetical protein